MNKSKVRKPKADAPGLITQVTSQLEASSADTPAVEPAPPTAPSASTRTGGDAPALELTPSEPPREKCGWYLAPDVVDEVRDAVDALKQKGLRIDGNAVDAGRLVERHIRAGLQELYDAMNGGKRFPVSPGTRAMRAKRKR